MTIEYARKLVAGYTSARTPDEIEPIAARMVETGECVWHAAAKVFGRECFCAACRPDVRRFA